MLPYSHRLLHLRCFTISCNAARVVSLRKLFFSFLLSCESIPKILYLRREIEHTCTTEGCRFRRQDKSVKTKQFPFIRRSDLGLQRLIGELKIKGSTLFQDVEVEVFPLFHACDE